ncbi:MAG: V-type ATP synthase subunit F [Actinomycetota bacterium]|nr:MAG: archaeal/vacuolar-type H+-ATPase subunit [Actinomycetota bacterium]MDO8949045.1 V-type ATP synthase subunit F [Actinomycetota bacterium]MDP3630612.1 V-type ATP synthase subunit F [Actinomycetota bacterium]
MYKLVVLTDSDTGDGFRLAGVDVITVDSPEEARKRLNELIDDDSSGIVAVNEAYMAEIDERTQQKINSTYRPIVITLPIREKLHTDEDHRAYLSRLIRRAIGFDITLRRG